MAKFYPAINDDLREFITGQQMFFVASAPHEGRVNLSPKGLDSLRVLNEKRVAYLDHIGSANETAAHLLDNGRLTLMFCSFAGDPLILRLYGTGRSVQPGHAEWEELTALFPVMPGARQIIMVEVESLQTSCGAGVPLYKYQGQRDGLVRWAEKKGTEGMRAYRNEKNRVSIDGLPTGLEE
ncbi:MAG: pyridoxamine 5'-phosphate oxidase family protein [Sulfuricella sp.]|nr:pyridoxamine 5'-phosphate oxidase family protein [Sulfuricella sp.]